MSLTPEKAATLKDLLGGDDALFQNVVSQIATTDKAAQDSGVAYKDTDAPAWAQALLGRIEALETSLKATPPAEVVAGEAPVEAKDDGMDMMAEGDGMEPEGDENMLTPAEIAAVAQAVVQALGPHLNIEQKMAGHLAEMKSLVGGMATQKDAALAEVKEQVVALTTQVADLSGSQPRIMAGGYRASQASATVTTDETRLKDAQPSADPVQASVAAFLADMGFGGPQQPTA